jgi:hypothetical protein
LESSHDLGKAHVTQVWVSIPIEVAVPFPGSMDKVRILYNPHVTHLVRLQIILSRNPLIIHQEIFLHPFLSSLSEKDTVLLPIS